jgi:two-component system NtrC family sensor kinase
MARRSESSASEETLDSKLQFIEELKRQWLATIDALVDPMIIVGADFRVRKCNHALSRVSGLPVQEIPGKLCYEVFAGLDKPCEGCSLTSVVKDKRPRTFSLDRIRGHSVFEVTSQPMLDRAGEIDGVVHVYRDRTEARAMQDRLIQNEKLASLGLLAGGVAHEINNPLGGIIVFSQMLLRELPEDDKHRVDVQEIEAAAQRCKLIVDSLLDFARRRPAGAKPGREVVNATESLQTALRLAKVSSEARMVEIVEELQGEAWVEGDRNRFIQLFLNMIQNAFHAMRQGGTLTLVNRREKDQWVFEIHDTGRGIPPEAQKQVFDPFYTTKEPGEGTGLGLAICHSIVAECRGTIEVRNRVRQRWKEGTTFVVRLPAKENIPAEGETSPSSKHAKGS